MEVPGGTESQQRPLKRPGHQSAAEHRSGRTGPTACPGSGYLNENAPDVTLSFQKFCPASDPMQGSFLILEGRLGIVFLVGSHHFRDLLSVGKPHYYTPSPRFSKIDFRVTGERK